MAAMMNIEILENFKFEANSQGNIVCPAADCDETFITVTDGLNPDGLDMLDRQVKYSIWQHMESRHPDLYKQIYQIEEERLKKTFITNNNKTEQALELLNLMNNKMTKHILSHTLSGTSIAQTMTSLKTEFEKTHNLLKDLLTPSTNNTSAKSIL